MASASVRANDGRGAASWFAAAVGLQRKAPDELDLRVRPFNNTPPFNELMKSMQQHSSTSHSRWSALVIIWAVVLWLSLPLIWSALSSETYFLRGARGLQDAELSGPLVFTVSCWAIALSFRRCRVPATIYAAGGFVLSLGFVLTYYDVFAHTAGPVLLMFASALFAAAKRESNVQAH